MQARTHRSRPTLRARLTGALAVALSVAVSILTVAGAAPFAVAGGHAAKRSLIATRCQEEIAKLCEGVKPGGGRLAHCLRPHDTELSNDCKAALAASWAGRASRRK